MAKFTKETWKPIAGFEGMYEISSDGRIKGLARLSANGKKLRERIMQQSPDAAGFPLVNLTKNGKSRCFYVKALFKEAFPKMSEWRFNCVFARLKAETEAKDSFCILQDGKSKTSAEVSKELGGSAALIKSRLKAGWSLERAISTPNMRSLNK